MRAYITTERQRAALNRLWNAYDNAVKAALRNASKPSLLATNKVRALELRVELEDFIYHDVNGGAPNA